LRLIFSDIYLVVCGRVEHQVDFKRRQFGFKLGGVCDVHISAAKTVDGMSALGKFLNEFYPELAGGSKDGYLHDGKYQRIKA
jgi:hypothetical protein